MNWLDVCPRRWVSLEEAMEMGTRPRPGPEFRGVGLNLCWFDEPEEERPPSDARADWEALSREVYPG